MKVLWITNIIFPEALGKLSGETEFKSSGGWMLGLADAIVSTGKVELIVASVSPVVDNLTKLTGKNITYYVSLIFTLKYDIIYLRLKGKCYETYYFTYFRRYT